MDAPVRSYLESHGYQVNAEVRGCDLTATKGEDLIVVELKTSPSMSLLVQAVDRQRVADSVYVAVPEPRRTDKHWRGVLRVLRRLELGLLVVRSTAGSARAIRLLDPGPSQPRRDGRRRRAIITEVAARSVDLNTGGSSAVPLVTAYRERAVHLAHLLDRHGPSSPAQLRRLGASEQSGQVLYANHYGWFRRVQRGIYDLTDTGRTDIQQYSQLVEQWAEAGRGSA